MSDSTNEDDFSLRFLLKLYMHPVLEAIHLVVWHVNVVGSARPGWECVHVLHSNVHALSLAAVQVNASRVGSDVLSWNLYMQLALEEVHLNWI